MRPKTPDVLLLAIAAVAFLAALAYASAEPLPIDPPSPSAPSSPELAASAAPATVSPGPAALAKARAGDPSPLTAMAEGGDKEAQAQLGNLYYQGLAGAKPDLKAARKWYEKAAAQGHPQANRTLGEMYAKGQGGKKDIKKAAQFWIAGEKAGDPLAATLLADQLFSDLTGGKTPGPGKYAFRGGVPLGDVETCIAWYQEAQKRDPRPEARARAAQALNALEAFRRAAGVTAETKKK